MLREPLATTCSEPFHRSSDGHNKHCGGGRSLTDAEALTRLLYQDCENPRCDHGFVERHPAPHDPSVHDGGGCPTDPCPSCGGSGRTLKDGVVSVRLPFLGGGAPGVFIPMSMLKDGE